MRQTLRARAFRLSYITIRLNPTHLGRAHIIRPLKLEHRTMSRTGSARAAAPDPAVRLYGPEAFSGMRRAGQLAAAALDMLVPFVKPGVTTDRLDKLSYEYAMDHHAYPAPLYYRGFPKSICTSVNHVVCHGIPGPKALREGDILNIDVTLILDGWHGDTSRMYGVGAISRKAERLIDVTFEALQRGIAVVKPAVPRAISARR